MLQTRGCEQYSSGCAQYSRGCEHAWNRNPHAGFSFDLAGTDPSVNQPIHRPDYSRRTFESVHHRASVRRSAFALSRSRSSCSAGDVERGRIFYQVYCVVFILICRRYCGTFTMTAAGLIRCVMAKIEHRDWCLDKRSV
jgi:hypothetical protein